MPRDRRRRNRNQRLPRESAPAPAGHNLAGRRVASAREWRWRTFPVFCTFAFTLFVTALLVEVFSGTAVGALISLIGAVLASGALAHLVVVRLIAPRIRPRERR